MCGSDNVEHYTAFFDKNNAETNLGLCSICQSIVPEYNIIESESAIKQQTKFHEVWWKDTTKEELENDLNSLHELVKFLGMYLGEPAEKNVVLEIGSGRGGLLKALIDAGYNAIGCEPASKLVDLARRFYSLPPEILFELTADRFIDDVVSTIDTKPRSVILWHVLEHVKNPLLLLKKLAAVLDDDGSIILQLPLLKKDYVYPEHYYFVSHETPNYIANKLGFTVGDIKYDADNLFVTICFLKSPGANRVNGGFLYEGVVPNPLAQGLLLRDEAISRQQYLLKERMIAIQSMEQMIIERDITIKEQQSLLDSHHEAMISMERLIDEKSQTIADHVSLLGEHDTAVGAMKKHIHDRDVQIAEQNKIIGDLVAMRQTTERRLEKLQLEVDGLQELNVNQEGLIRSLEASVNERSAEVVKIKKEISEIEARAAYKLLRRIGLF
ncbi:methyltransferase domain-containing protein [Ochrobactrum sp. CM-21-5]|nr:methyltransferase domain-containing protein [Ochrobactrum sp. CM-21-5]MBC2884666.1 methyltransferase domain-containing protein [Ochrobactrum sp. CM-21-5]